ncbi:MAG: hypothetical protein ABI837_00215 [Acidobacteriota bacterium]
MDNILRMLFPALEPSTAASIVAITLTTTAALVFLIGLARRRHSYWWLPMAIAAVGFSVSALASWVGVRMFAAVFQTVTTNGGGVGAISAGICESAQLPLTAAWIGLITSLVAAIFHRPFAGHDTTTEGSRPVAFALLITAGLTIGIAPLLAFRPAITFVLRAITPGTAIPAAKVMEHVLAYEVIIGCCFVAAMGVTAAITRLARHSPRSQTVSSIMTIALLVTVAVSAFSAASLRDASSRFREVARYGRVSAIER